MTADKWSTQQNAIFAFLLSLSTAARNLVVRARAGTGKTTTILEGVRRLAAAAPSLSICLCAFNKRIAEELTHRLGSLPNACAKTLHSLGYGCILPIWKGVKVDGRRSNLIARRVCGEQAPKAVVKAVAKLAGLAKNMAPLLPYAESRKAEVLSTLLRIGADFEVFPSDPLECGEWTDEDIAEATARAVHAATQQDGTIDFDDMVYLPLALNLARGKFDVLLVDEAQDMNFAQLELARRLLRRGGSMAVIGDDRQACYGFRGADAGSLDRLKAELNAEELPLTTTYRCGKAIVALAARLVPDFAADARNPEGAVSNLKADKLLGAVAPGNFVLSRKNAPLMSICLQLLKQNVRAKIVGRDVGDTLAALVRRLGRQGDTGSLLSAIDRWEQKEVQVAVRTENEARQQEATDKADVLRALAEDVETVDEVLARIDVLFADLVAGQPIKSVVLSSIHKAKGLEADKVFVLTDTLYPGKNGRGKIEEVNLDYIATTRAKTELVLVAG